MSHYSKKDILRLVEEEDVEFIRLQFTDLFGGLKNVAVTASQLERVLEPIRICSCVRIWIRWQSSHGVPSRARWPG